MRAPSISWYGNCQSRSGKINATVIVIPDVTTFWFSYQTLVAFLHPERGLVVHKNDWGPTTGRHLSWIDGGEKHKRVDHETFMNLLRDLDAATMRQTLRMVAAERPDR